MIEAGFPIASEGDFESVAAVAAEIRDVSVCGLARTGVDPGSIDEVIFGNVAQPAHAANIARIIGNLTSAIWFSWGVLLNSGIGEGKSCGKPLS